MQKHILMVLDEEFPPDDRVYKEAQSLINEGFLVSIVSYTLSDRPNFEIIDGINVYRKKISNFVYKSSVAALKFPIYFNWWKRYLNSIISKNKFDIIHIHDLPLSKVGVYFKQKYNLKLVIDLHENWPAMLEKATHTNTFIGKILSPIKQWREYENNILKQADLIVTVVDEMKDRISKLKVNFDKITILPNTISLNDFVNLDLSVNKTNEQFTLFFAGGLNIERGLQYVIKGLKIIKNTIPNIKLIIVGKGSYQTTLEQIAYDCNVKNNVDFIGWKPLKEVLQLTAQADVTLIPHIKWEQTDCSSPNKLFQCMFVGVPLLVSNCNSVARIVNKVGCGISYKFDNAKEFAEKVEFLYSNKKERICMGEKGQSAIIEKYNWRETSKDFLNKMKGL